LKEELGFFVVKIVKNQKFVSHFWYNIDREAKRCSFKFTEIVMVKSQTQVRAHVARSKKGKLAPVRQHTRKLNEKQKLRLQRHKDMKLKLQEHRSAAFGRAVEAGRSYIRAYSDKEKARLYNEFANRERVEAVKTAVKALPHVKKRERIKRYAERIHARTEKMYRRVFGRAERIRSRLLKRGKLSLATQQGHPAATMPVGTVIKFQGQELYPKWKVTKTYEEGGARYMSLSNLGMKGIEQTHPVAKLASWYDRGMFAISPAKKAKKNLVVHEQKTKQQEKKPEKITKEDVAAIAQEIGGSKKK